MKMQVTVFDKNKKYRPIATVIEVESVQDFYKNKKTYIKKAMTKMAQKRYKTSVDLYNEGYTVIKARPYSSIDRKEEFMKFFAKENEKREE